MRSLLAGCLYPGGDPVKVDAGRTKRAFAVLAALFAVLGAAGLVYPANSNAGEGLRQGAAFVQSYDMLGSVLSGDLPEGDEVPAWFADELFYIEGAQSYASEDVDVYGFVSEDSSSALVADVLRQMQERGWVLAGSADDGGPFDTNRSLDAARPSNAERSADVAYSADPAHSAGSVRSSYLSFSRPGGEPSSVVVGFTEQDLSTTVVVQVMG